MRNIRNVQFRQQNRGVEEAEFPGNCGRKMDDECGLIDPLQCAVHGPLLLEPSKEESEKAIAQARAIRLTLAQGLH